MHYAGFFGNDDLDAVHNASLRILEATGLRVQSAGARELLAGVGCSVDASRERIRIPAKVVERAMATIPPSFVFRGRDPAKDISIPEDRPAFATASSAPFVNDPKTGERRYATSRDIANIAHLVDASPGYDLFSISVLAEDSPPGQLSLSRFYPALKNCSKPVRSNTPSIKDLEAVLELGRLIAGGAEAYAERPFINHHYCPVISPLTMDLSSTESVIYLLERGLPVYGSIVPNAGMTSPMSLAGTLALGNAEFLALCVLMQAVRPGSPVIYAVLSTVADMRTGAYAPGAIETAMLQMGHSQLARRYGLPSGGYIGLSGAHQNDAQSGYETGMSATAALLGGADLFNTGGLLGSLLAFDFGKAVIDGEIALMLKRLARGMDPRDAAGCLGLIDEVGPGGAYIEQEHTAANMRSEAFLPRIATRDSFDGWTGAGSRDAARRAADEALRILGTRNEAAIGAEVDARIRKAFPGLVPGEAGL
jgi:trimethylamine--corrinoid protein Co-methyltransferase